MTIRSRPIIGLRVGERLQAVEPALAPSCSITLTTDNNAGFGISDAQIDGQRIFIENINDQNLYGATTDLANPTAFWASGTRWIEPQSLAEVGSKPRVDFLEPGGAQTYGVAWSPSVNRWQFRIEKPAGTAVADNYVNGAITDKVAIGLDSAGNCRAIINDTEIDLTVAQDQNSGTLSAFDSYWPTDDNVALLPTIGSDGSGTTPRSGSITTATRASDYNNDFSGITGTNEDFCGNEI